MHIHKKIAHCDASFDEEGTLLSKKSFGHKGVLKELLGIETALNTLQQK